MACCGRDKKTPRSVPIQRSPVKAAPTKSKAPARTQAPPGSFNPPGRFCSKCGWIVATSKYVDPASGAIVEKKSCTNRKCSDYS